MTRVTRKPVFWVSDQVRALKPQTMARALDFLIREVEGLYSYFEATSKVRTSCAVTKQLICAFVFSNAKTGFTRDAAHLPNCPNVSSAIFPKPHHRVPGNIPRTSVWNDHSNEVVPLDVRSTMSGLKWKKKKQANSENLCPPPRFFFKK